MLLVALLATKAFATEFGSPIRIGVLTSSWGSPPGVYGLTDGLTALGYREYEDFVIGVRFTRGDNAALLDAAEAMLRDGVDIIYAIGEEAVKAAQHITTEHPILFTAVSDPVRLGLVDSLARPGRNTTGVTDLNLSLSAKRLSIFKKLVPSLERVFFPYNQNNPYQETVAAYYREVAKRLGVVFLVQKLRTMEEARDTLGALRKEDVDGILAPKAAELNITGFALQAAKKQGIPVVGVGEIYLLQGALATVGGVFYQEGQRLASMIDQIKEGMDAGQIPIETNKEAEIVLNLDVAKRLGISISAEILQRVDRVIPNEM